MGDPVDREWRIAVHEAGHAVAHLVLGRPIARAVVDVPRHLHQVDGVQGSRISMPGEGILMAAGWAAEERLYRELGWDEATIGAVRRSGGHDDDFEMLDRLADLIDEVDADEAKAAAATLVDEYWPAVIGLAEALLAERVLDQGGVERVCAPFGTHPPADSVRTDEA